MGRWPNLTSPQSFTEKIQYRKIHDRDDRLVTCSDKVLVKNYVAQKIGVQYVIPTLWHGKKLPSAGERDWPAPYVIKSNHGSGSNLFVRCHEDAAWSEIEVQTNGWMRKRYKPHLREHHYDKIDRQILVEPMIGCGDAPDDYKFYLFNGRVEFILVYKDRGVDLRTQMFDRDWNIIPCRYYRDAPLAPPSKPQSFDEMVSLAEELGSEFCFVRADFYEVDNRPYFGELTFMPGSGFRPYEADGIDQYFGALWDVGKFKQFA